MKPDRRFYLVEGIELIDGQRVTGTPLGHSFVVGEAAANLAAARLRWRGWVAVGIILWSTDNAIQLGTGG